MPVDICNRKIEPGCLVVYPVRKLSFMWMALAEVIWMGQQCIKVKVVKYSDPWREVPRKILTVYRLDKVVVVREAPAPIRNNVE